MDRLSELIREYRSFLEEERQLNMRKEKLRSDILQEMSDQRMKHFSCPYGRAMQSMRVKLLPKSKELLEVLTGEDILPFAQFTPAKVRKILVPKYGRDSLLPLFDVEKISYLQVRGSTGKDREESIPDFLE